MNIPDCSICGKPSRMGDKCHACKALRLRGYDIETTDISGAKDFLNASTAHFYAGYKASQSDILAENMRKFGDEARSANPSVNQIAKVIYERAFDCQWDELVEKDDAEYFLWLAVGEAVQKQFFEAQSAGGAGER